MNEIPASASLSIDIHWVFNTPCSKSGLAARSSAEVCGKKLHFEASSHVKPRKSAQTNFGAQNSFWAPPGITSGVSGGPKLEPARILSTQNKCRIKYRTSPAQARKTAKCLFAALARKMSTMSMREQKTFFFRHEQVAALWAARVSLRVSLGLGIAAEYFLGSSKLARRYS